ncbi:MAG TPA: C4-type zinc ribbon domain-containing protein [Syntrophales bacterium]|nr:C4-type zinc ribbon domain-containing protein [Syntrophales bacterium]
MDKQLAYLIELQKLDLNLDKINIKKRELPEKIAQMDENFVKYTASMDESKRKFDELNKRHGEKEDKLKRGIETLKKTKERLLEVKTNKEYQAILKEIEVMENKNSETEDEIISALEELDQVRVGLKSKEKDFNAYKLQYEKEKKRIEEEISQLEIDFSDCMQTSDNLKKQIRNELLKKYDTIKGKRNGLAVVSVWKEVCGGCHMNIPPQLYIELQRSVELLSCPNCNRIIYWFNQDKTDE